MIIGVGISVGCPLSAVITLEYIQPHSDVNGIRSPGKAGRYAVANLLRSQIRALSVAYRGGWI
jgi:hypothetical protein